MSSNQKIIFDNHPTLPFEEFDSPATESPAGDGSISISGTSITVDAEQELAIGKDDDRHNDTSRLLNYISLASGSSGNCCYVGNENGGFLIDAGIRDDEVTDILKKNGIPMSKVKGLLLTHDHSDHVRYAYSILRNNKHMRLFCSNRVMNGILRRHSISKRIKEYHTPIFKEIPFKLLNFEITAFEVPHDGTDNMGFSILFDNRRFVLATDLGEVQSRARFYMQQANYLVIEANYDLQMLLHGKYPEYLKARIQTERGHLDNMATGKFLNEIINPSLKYIFLCHLSKDNNTPSKALKAVKDALAEKNIKIGRAEESTSDREADVQLMVLPRFEPTRLFVFRPF